MPKVLEEIAKDGTALGSGILLYQLLHKYADPLYNHYLPWIATVPNVGWGQSLTWFDFFVTLIAQKYGVRNEAAKEWLLEHGLSAGLSGLIGLAFTPAMYVVSGPTQTPYHATQSVPAGQQVTMPGMQRVLLRAGGVMP
jgi:hypothetical protein